MTPNSELFLRDNSGNPAPLGLFGFGVTTVLLNLANAGWIPFDSVILAMGICFGGLAQIIAGILESRKGNTFGLTAFVSYGFFWLSLVVLILLPKSGWTSAPSSGSMGAYLIMWGIFTALLWMGTFRINKALQVVFGTLTLLFALLAISELTGKASIHKVAGYIGIICGASAIYNAAAILLNEVCGRTVWSIGPVKSA